MDDPILCCLLEICCSPLRAMAALTKYLESRGLPEEAATLAATVMIESFDFAEKGSLAPFKASVARLARGQGPKEAA